MSELGIIGMGCSVTPITIGKMTILVVDDSKFTTEMIIEAIRQKYDNPSLIVVDYDRKIDVSNISNLEELIKNMETRNFENERSLPYIIRNTHQVHENTLMYDDAFRKPKNPHKKSRNCKIRRR